MRPFSAWLADIAGKPPAGVSMAPIEHQGVSSSNSVHCNHTAAPFQSLLSHGQNLSWQNHRLYQSKMWKTPHLHVFACFWVRRFQQPPTNCLQVLSVDGESVSCCLNDRKSLLPCVLVFGLFTFVFQTRGLEQKSHGLINGSCLARRFSALSLYTSIKSDWATVWHQAALLMITVVNIVTSARQKLLKLNNLTG